jgi:hypothetical protein
VVSASDGNHRGRTRAISATVLPESLQFMPSRHLTHFGTSSVTSMKYDSAQTHCMPVGLTMCSIHRSQVMPFSCGWLSMSHGGTCTAPNHHSTSRITRGGNTHLHPPLRSSERTSNKLRCKTGKQENTTMSTGEGRNIIGVFRQNIAANRAGHRSGVARTGQSA